IRRRIGNGDRRPDGNASDLRERRRERKRDDAEVEERRRSRACGRSVTRDSMRTNMLGVAARVLVIALGALTVGVTASPGRLVVHEWGTFLAMNGSDGVTLDGMYHEEHALPAFVHARSRDELKLRTSNMKMETPVVYFYSDTTMKVRVEVGFPGGIWTQWYPQAEYVGP